MLVVYCFLAICDCCLHRSPYFILFFALTHEIKYDSKAQITLIIIKQILSGNIRLSIQKKSVNKIVNMKVTAEVPTWQSISVCHDTQVYIQHHTNGKQSSSMNPTTGKYELSSQLG